MANKKITYQNFRSLRFFTLRIGKKERKKKSTQQNLTRVAITNVTIQMQQLAKNDEINDLFMSLSR